MAIIRIARVGNEKVFPLADGFPHPGVELAGGRVVENQLEFRVLLHPYGAPGGAHPLLQVVPQGKGVILETGAGQGGARLHLRIEVGLHHEQVVVPRFMENVPRFPLDQIPQHIVGHPAADRPQHLAVAHQRLIEHQGHGVVETGGGRRQGGGPPIHIGAMEKGLLQARRQGPAFRHVGAGAPWLGGIQHFAGGRHQKNFGEIPGRGHFFH